MRASERSIGGKTWVGYTHSACGQEWKGIDWKDSSSDYSGSHPSTKKHTYNKLVCVKDETTIESAAIEFDP